MSDSWLPGLADIWERRRKRWVTTNRADRNERIREIIRWQRDALGSRYGTFWLEDIEGLLAEVERNDRTP